MGNRMLKSFFHSYLSTDSGEGILSLTPGPPYKSLLKCKITWIGTVSRSKHRFRGEESINPLKPSLNEEIPWIRATVNGDIQEKERQTLGGGHS